LTGSATLTRVYRQVATLEILLEADGWGKLGYEAAVARGGLALEPCQRVLLLGLRVQEHREFASDRAITQAQHLLRCRADHHPVALCHGSAQQLIPDCAANQIDLHARAC